MVSVDRYSLVHAIHISLCADSAVLRQPVGRRCSHGTGAVRPNHTEAQHTQRALLRILRLAGGVLRLPWMRPLACLQQTYISIDWLPLAYRFHPERAFHPKRPVGQGTTCCDHPMNTLAFGGATQRYFVMLPQTPQLRGLWHVTPFRLMIILIIRLNITRRIRLAMTTHTSRTSS